MGYRTDIDRVIDMEYGISIWNTVHRYGHLPYRYGHPGYRYGIWANDIGDDHTDMVILDCHSANSQMPVDLTARCARRTPASPVASEACCPVRCIASACSDKERCARASCSRQSDASCSASALVYWRKLKFEAKLENSTSVSSAETQSTTCHPSLPVTMREWHQSP